MKTLYKGVLSAALLVSAFCAPTYADDKIKVGFVFIGPIGDHGWTYQHNEGRVAVEEALGDKVETTYVENVSEGADAPRVINQLANSGHDVIFTTSFGYMNPTIKVAKSHPKIKFEHATGFKRADNVATYSGRFYEGRYVLGHVAGRLTKSNTIGYIASFPIPEVIRGINATLLGARKVNPDVEIKVIWVSSWFDPGKESDAAKALIDQGADVIFQHTDSPAPVQTAEKRGVWAVGQASDMHSFGKNAHVAAIIDDWAPYYIARVKEALDDSWTSTDTWGGLASGMVKISEYNKAIPKDIVTMAHKVEQSIVDGSAHPFAGPIKDQAGNIIVAAGENAPDGMLLGMNVYVEGIIGTIPN